MIFFSVDHMMTTKVKKRNKKNEYTKFRLGMWEGYPTKIRIRHINYLHKYSEEWDKIDNDGDCESLRLDWDILWNMNKWGHTKVWYSKDLWTEIFTQVMIIIIIISWCLNSLEGRTCQPTAGLIPTCLQVGDRSSSQFRVISGQRIESLSCC